MSISRRKAAKTLFGTGLGALMAPSQASAAEADATPRAADSLDALARAKGLGFGNAMGISASGTRKGSRFHDPRYRALMAAECGVIVAENETKWPALQPRPGRFNFAPADEMFAWARAQQMRVRGHTLVWQTPKRMPQWLNQHDFGAEPVREAERLLTEHVSTVCRHFGDTIYSWDVVNEAVDPADGELRSNVLAQRLGAVAQIDLTFRLAREHAPQAQLVYNDYMHWDSGSARHRAGVLALLQALKARGTPVQALGLQSHITAWDPAKTRAAGGEPARAWRAFLDEVTALGLELLITEFDVSDRELPADPALRDAGVAARARDYLDVTLAYPRLRDFLLWGMADSVSWLQDDNPRADGLPKRPCPWDERFQPKALRGAIADALRAMPPRAAS